MKGGKHEMRLNEMKKSPPAEVSLIKRHLQPKINEIETRLVTFIPQNENLDIFLCFKFNEERKIKKNHIKTHKFILARLLSALVRKLFRENSGNCRKAA